MTKAAQIAEAAVGGYLMDLPELETSFSERQAADLLTAAGWTISVATLKRLRTLRLIPYHQFGGRIRYTHSDLETIITDAHRPPQPSPASGGPKNSPAPPRGGPLQIGERKSAGLSVSQKTLAVAIMVKRGLMTREEASAKLAEITGKPSSG